MFDSEGNLLSGWGSFGYAVGQFNGPFGIAVDSSGNVYVADSGNHRIQKFDLYGEFLTQWGTEGSGDGQFGLPKGIAVDGSGNVFVTDSGNHRIQKFDSEGNFLTQWGTEGYGDGQFHGPYGIAVDGSGNVYVTYEHNYCIQKFDSEGNFLTQWGAKGSGDGQFDLPTGIAVDGSGNVYVTDSWNHRIQKFDSEGNFLTKWGEYGAGNEQFAEPHGIAVDASGGNVYVVDTSNNCIKAYITPYFSEQYSRESNSVVVEMLVQKASLEATVTGDLDGTLSFSELEIVTVNSGSFTGKGFCKGEWIVRLKGGANYSGNWEGMCFLDASESVVYLKGRVFGDEASGIIEGHLTESVPGSGVYDQYRAIWRLGRLGTGIEAISWTLDVDGNLSYHGSPSIYPSTEIQVLQASSKGTTSGHYTLPLSIVLTHLRVTDQNNPYCGEGFSIISYVSDLGQGEGWTYDKLVVPNGVQLRGLFTKPHLGIVFCFLDVTSNNLFGVMIQRIDLGLPPVPDLGLIMSGPGRVSPGQTIDYIIEYRNDGFKKAENVVVVNTLPFLAEYKSSTSQGIHWWDRNQVFWRLGTLLPKSKGYLSVKVHYPWGLTTGTSEFTFSVIGTTSPAKHKDLFDIDKYLVYEPLKIVSKRPLTPEETVIELSDERFRNLYDYATELGFNQVSAPVESVFTDGRRVIWLGMVNTDFDEILFITKDDKTSFIQKYTEDKILFFDTNGGMSFNPIDNSFESWGNWSETGSISMGECVSNCIIDQVSLSLLGELIPEIGFILSEWYCVQCFSGDDDACYDCIAALVPIVGPIIVYCIRDCQERTSSHACEPCNGQNEDVCKKKGVCSDLD